METAAPRWGWVVARGVVGVLFGLVAFGLPRMTWLALLMVFAAFALIEGFANIVSAIRAGRSGEARWWTLLIEGMLSVGVGILAVIWPATATVAFMWVLAFWAIVTGVLEISAAIRLRKLIQGEWALGLAGALSIVFGVLMAVWPAAGTLALVWWMGGYALIFGLLMIVVGFRLRRQGRTEETPPPAAHYGKPRAVIDPHMEPHAPGTR